MKATLKRLVSPLREWAGRFVVLPSAPPPFRRETLLFKVASFIAAERIAGDYLEFGVFRGQSLCAAFAAFERAFTERSRLNDYAMNEADSATLVRLWQDMRFFGFDSFQGLPPLTGRDQQGACFAEGHYRASQQEVVEHLTTSGVPVERVLLVEGWYAHTLHPDTARAYNLTTAAVIHVDCDLYESAHQVLRFVQPFLTDGTVLIFDDWYAFRGNPGLGEQRAFREWQEALPEWGFTEYQKEGPFRNSFIANKRHWLSWMGTFLPFEIITYAM